MRSQRCALHLRAAQWYAGRDPSLHAEQLEAAQDSGAAQAYLHAAKSESEHGRLERALRRSLRGLAIVKEPRTRHALLCRVGDAQRNLGKLEACLSAHEKARAQSERAGSPALQALALGGIGDANFLRGHMLSAQENFAQCVRLAQGSQLSNVEAGNLPMLAACNVYVMHYTEGVRLYDKGVALARKLGHLLAEIVGHSVGSLLHFSLGDLARAKSSAEQMLLLAQRLRARRFESEAKSLLGIVAWALNDLHGAEDLLDEAVASGTKRNGMLKPWLPTLLKSHCLGLTSSPREDVSWPVSARESTAKRCAKNSLHCWRQRTALNPGSH